MAANIWPYNFKAKDNEIQPLKFYKQHKTMKEVKMNTHHMNNMIKISM
jgi:hypothetical protein